MSKLNSEFNYRYQVIGETPWAKIQTLQGFLVGRQRAAALEEVQSLKYQAKLAELEHLQGINALPHRVLNLRAEIIELESSLDEAKKCFQDNREEIEILERLLSELYAIAEPSRIPGYTDEQMFEANAANEFTAMIGKDIQAEIVANGRPSPAKLRNAMSNPHTFKALQAAGLIPEKLTLPTGESIDFLILEANHDPLRIELKPV